MADVTVGAGVGSSITVSSATPAAVTAQGGGSSAVNVVPATPVNVIVEGALAGPTGPAGANGTSGTNGTNGTNGVGVPTGGSTGQVLSKADNTNYNTTWVTLGAGTGDMVLALAQTVTGSKIFNAGKLHDKGSMVFDVTAYGAVGDDSIDNLAAINLAIAAIAAVHAVLSVGATLYFPHGVYPVSGPIVVPKKVHVRGAGKYATKVYRQNAGILFDFSGTATSHDGSTHNRYSAIADLALEGNGLTGALLRAYYIDNFTASNVRFQGSASGALDIVEMWDSYFHQCVFEDMTSTTVPVIYIRSSMAGAGFGFGSDNSNMIWFNQCHVESFKHNAVRIESGTGATDGANNGIFFNQFKVENSTVRAPLMYVESSTMNFQLNQFYFYLGAFDGGFATPVNALDIHSHAATTISGGLIGVAIGIVASGINLSSADGSCRVENVTVNGTPGTSVINISAAGGELSFDAITTSSAAPLFSGADRTSTMHTARTIYNDDTVNNPTALHIINAGSGIDFAVENTANDANFNIVTTGVAKAAFANLFATTPDYFNFAGWYNGTLAWRVGRQGDTDGVSIYTNAGVTKTAQFKDNGNTEIFGQLTVDKGVKPRVTSLASSATPTLNADTDDVLIITALATGATFGAPTGTPVDGQKFMVRVKDNGTARALAFNAAYRFSTSLAAPTTTVLGKTLYMGFIYNLADTKYDCLAILGNF
jgi:hypothetical protein